MITVSLKELHPSPLNVREYKSTEIEALKQSIKQQGLLQSLVVVPNGKGYQVVAGGRRLAALKALKYKEPIPVQVVEGATEQELVEASLAENIYRQNITDYQVWAAIKSSLGDNITVKAAKEMAKRMHFSVEEVRKAAALASVHPDIVQLYIDGKIHKQMLQVLTVLPSTDEQLALFNKLTEENDGRYPSAWTVKEKVGFGGYQQDRMLDKIGGLKAYKKAGGTYTTDLFGDDVIIHDKPLLAKLYKAAYEAEDEAKAKRLGIIVLTKGQAKASDSAWEHIYLPETWASEEDRERAWEISDVLHDNDEELPEENRQALEDELEELESRKAPQFNKGYEYGVYMGQVYARKVESDEDTTAEPEPEAPNISAKAIDACNEIRKQRAIRTAECYMPRDSAILSFTFAVIRSHFNKMGGMQANLYNSDVSLEHAPKWVWHDNENEAYDLFLNSTDTFVHAMFASMFERLSRDTFRDKRLNDCGAEELDFTADEDFMSLFHSKATLKALAEDIGWNSPEIIDANSVADGRRILADKINDQKIVPSYVKVTQ